MLTNCLAACVTVSEIQRDICEKIGILSYPLHSTPPLGGFPSEYRHSLWYGKIRMVLLTDGEKISKISLFVLAQLTNVTDRRTDRHRVTAIAALCIASHGKNQIHLLVRIIICSFHLPVPWHYMRSIGSRAPWLDESPVASCVWVVLFSFSDCRQLANFVNVLATTGLSVVDRIHRQLTGQDCICVMGLQDRLLKHVD